MIIETKKGTVFIKTKGIKGLTKRILNMGNEMFVHYKYSVIEIPCNDKIHYEEVFKKIVEKINSKKTKE